MKFFKKSFLFLLFLYFISHSIYAAIKIIPFNQFHNVNMNPADMIITNYNFDSHLIIFCFDNTLQTFGAITWRFQGIPRTSQLPIFLKTKANVQGEFADPVGTIFITNTTNTASIVSCEFGF